MKISWQFFLKEELSGLERLVVLGTGNALKADDAAGLLVANLLDHQLNRRQKSRIKVLRAYEIIDTYLKRIKRLKPSHLIIVDAIDLNKRPGYTFW
jgi:Ni,Fe-hydrogenase maturation factor